MQATPLLHLRQIVQSFPKPDGSRLLVLDRIDLDLAEGEIVGLLGRSGSGKSTLLRLIAGLAHPISGEISCLGEHVTGPEKDVAMVFQSFALFPWLTVLQNVQLGLEALGLPAKEQRQRSLEAIDLIGLDGYESAYPRELSGGMRQRVGFARALVVHPTILLMDEPFSALDVLTAETLRSDFLDLWAEGELPIKGVILVTHNVEEAVLMCDRVLIFSTNPARIVREIKVSLPQPRARLDPAFRAVVEQIYVEMTTNQPSAEARPRNERFAGSGIGTVLPRISTNVLSGLIETVAGQPYQGKADLPVIAASLQMEIDDLFRAGETLQLLRFAEVAGGDIRLTDAGKRFADAEVDERKQLFARQLLTYVPLVAHIRRVLDERPSHVAPRSRFFDELEDYMTTEDAEQTLRAAVSWGRYAEIYAYDDDRQMFSLENPA